MQYARYIVQSRRTTEVEAKHWKSSSALITERNFVTIFSHLYSLISFLSLSQPKQAGSSSSSSNSDGGGSRHNKSNFIHSRCRSLSLSFSVFSRPISIRRLLLGTTLWARVFISLLQDSVYWCITNIVIVVASSSFSYSFSLSRCYYFFAGMLSFMLCLSVVARRKEFVGYFFCAVAVVVVCFILCSAFSSIPHAVPRYSLSISISPCTKNKRQTPQRDFKCTLFFFVLLQHTVPVHTHTHIHTNSNSFSVRRSFCFYNNNNLL